LFDASLFDFVLDSGASNLPDDRADSFLILSGGPGFVGINFFDFFNLFSDDFFVSFGLIALAEGTGVFSIDKSNDNAPLFADSINGVELVVDDSLPVSASVSAPASLGLFAMAALALIGFRRKA